MTAAVIDALITQLQAHDWPEGLAPGAVHFGEIPPMTHALELGVMPGDQEPRELLVDETEETFTLQMSLVIDPGDQEQTLRDGLALRQELRGVIAGAGNLGLSDVSQVNLLAASTGIGIDTRSGMNAWVLAVDIRFSVTYRDDF